MTPLAQFIATLFYACYALAFVLEVFRLVQPREAKWSIVRWRTFPVVIGLLLHTFLLYQLHVVAGGAAMLLFTAAWGLVLLSLLWTYRYPNIPFGIIVLPVAMLLIVGGCLSISPTPETNLSLRSLTKMLHVASATGFVIALAVWCVCSLLYRLEVRLLRKKRSLAPPTKLPSLEWSQTIKRLSLVVAAVCLSLCGLGIVLFWLS